MSLIYRSVVVAALCSLPFLAACSADPDPNPAPAAAPAAGTASASKQNDGLVSGAIQEALKEARQGISGGNITLSGHNDSGKKAEITPAGDLLIDGKAVAIDARQRALLLDYRNRIAQVALAGAGIGVQGAELASKAVTESLKSVFSGNTDEIEKHMEAEAAKIQTAALQLCDRLPAVLESQRALAQALPEFASYATMSEDDIEDCRNETKADATQAAKQ